MAGRLLIQGSSGAGKSRTLRKIIEEAFDFTTIILVDPEGEFGNLAAHIGAPPLKACEITTDALSPPAARVPPPRPYPPLDPTALATDQRIPQHAALFAAIIGGQPQIRERPST